MFKGLLATLLILSTCDFANAQSPAIGKQLRALVIEGGLSEAIEVFTVDKSELHTIGGKQHFVGAGFQPSVVMDDDGAIHVFFQARLDGSGDRSEKMIAHVVSRDGGKSFSALRFVNELPMQTYAISAFMRTAPSGVRRISVLTSLSIDETVERLKDPELIKKQLGIDVSRFSRAAATLVLEFYSDDFGKTWNRKEHWGISDRVYERNDREYYLAFINLIGQVRRIDAGPFSGRLILGGPLRGDYMPCEDHPRFRNYHSSSSLIFSDDQGETWKFGGVINDDSAFKHNEASAAPVNGGRQVLLARRNNKKGASGKTMHLSNDGGETWEDGFLTDIAATRCLQVLESHGELVLCSAPGKTNRTHGTIYISRDHGTTWKAKIVDEGAFSYSTVNKLSDDYLICCFSRGHHGEQGIAARIFSKGWLDSK